MMFCFGKNLYLNSSYKFIKIYQIFQDSCSKIVNSLATLKTKYVPSNQAPFINKQLRITIMIRLKLIFKRKEMKVRKKAYCKQRNN